DIPPARAFLRGLRRAGPTRPRPRPRSRAAAEASPLRHRW
ncbi:MAG: hypothetical protein AVDCRST_MAG65-278, partial [uncultured Solirubrobacteraceae bacterium]